MGETSERCRMMDKQKYWTEFESTRHQFFKIMIGDFEHQLRIPRKFMRNFKENLLDTISLRGPSGYTWKVKLARTVDDVLFKTGWEKFVRDQSLAETDFLVFRYNGNSSFSVTIFNETGCERVDSYFFKKHHLCSDEGCVMQGRLKRGRGNQSSKPVGTNDECHRPKAMKGRGIQGAKSVGARQVTRIKMEEFVYAVDGSEDFKHSRPKKLRLVNEDESEASEEVQIPSPKRGRKKKRKLQNATQVDVLEKFTSKKQDSKESLDSHHYWSRDHGNGKHRTAMDELEITDQLHGFDTFKSSGKRDGEEARSSKSIQLEHKPRRKEIFSDVPPKEPKMEPDMTKKPLDQSLSYGLYFISSRREVSEKEKQRAFKLATKHSSTGPSLLVIMRSTYVYKYFSVNFSKEWATKHIGCIDLKIQLRVPPSEKKWDVQFKNSKWKCGLTRGWANFVMDNNLEEHDVCIFKLTKEGQSRKKPVILDVTIYRVVEEKVPLMRFMPPRSKSPRF